MRGTKLLGLVGMLSAVGFGLGCSTTYVTRTPSAVKHSTEGAGLHVECSFGATGSGGPLRVNVKTYEELCDQQLRSRGYVAVAAHAQAELLVRIQLQFHSNRWQVQAAARSSAPNLKNRYSKSDPSMWSDGVPDAWGERCGAAGGSERLWSDDQFWSDNDDGPAHYYSCSWKLIDPSYTAESRYPLSIDKTIANVLDRLHPIVKKDTALKRQFNADFPVNGHG